jgi:hypothetical protein
MSMWSKWIKGRTVDATESSCASTGHHRIVVETGVDDPEMPARCLLCICLVARAYTPVMSTKRPYRAILRELYKAVCILSHLISCFLPLYISSRLARGPREVGQLRRTCVLFSSPPSPVTLTTTPKMSSHSYVLSACTR